jgi:hypothetical protein
VCGLDSTGSGQGPVADYCECGGEHLGSGATELVRYCRETMRAERQRQRKV